MEVPTRNKGFCCYMQKPKKKEVLFLEVLPKMPLRQVWLTFHFKLFWVQRYKHLLYVCFFFNANDYHVLNLDMGKRQKR